MASDGASNHDAATSAAPSGASSVRGAVGNKRDAPDVLFEGTNPGVASPDATDPESAASSAAKKRKTGSGARGVANLTPEQLAKKRANDREAQRAIRERTKNQIEALERRIQDLTSQQPYQDLQNALRAKAAVEAENADIKRRLATIMSLVQPLVSPQQSGQPQEPPQVSPSLDQASAPSAYQASAPAFPVQHVSTPRSATSSVSLDHQYSPRQPSPSDPHSQGKMLNQQRHDLRHNLDLGAERLGLGFLLEPTQNCPKVSATMNGAQITSPHYPLPSHLTRPEWSAAAGDGGGSGYAASSPAGSSSEASKDQVSGSYSIGGQRHPSTTSNSSAHSHAQPLPSPGYLPPTDIKNSPPTCPLDTLLLDLLHERRQRAADGVPTHELIGPRYPSVSSLLNPANSKYSHRLSRVFTDILRTFPDLSGLPERVATLYIRFLFMRWQIAPTRENLDRLPPWAVPVPAQLEHEHPAWIDHIPFPRMREFLASKYNPREHHFEMFFVPFTTTLSLNWPYEETDTLLLVPDSNDVMINPVFERHLRRLENWTLGEAFANTFKSLEGTYNFRKGSGPHRQSAA